MKGSKKITIFQVVECVICMDETTTHVFRPCGHQCSCKKCSFDIMKAGMDCPMCRASIQKSVAANILVDVAHETVGTKEYIDFSGRRDVYIKTLRSRCAGNAGYTGGGKLARSIAHGMGDELEQLRMENAATERMMVGKRAEIIVVDNLFTATYKPKGKRNVVEETFDFTSLDTLKDNIAGSETWSVMDLATYHPRYYWLIYFYFEKNVEHGMKELNLLEVSKRRRR